MQTPKNFLPGVGRSVSPIDLAFLSAAGSMGSLIAAHDWSCTPLGPISQWPQSLRTSISLMLNSRHPMWIGWGPEATFLYNDAYVDVLSLAKHPWALGRPAAEVWAEIWDICGPLADKVFQQAEASFVDDVRLFMSRGTYLEETYFSFSYSPIADERGQVGGLFCPSTDVTAKNLNTRRLHTLSALAASALIEKSVDATTATAAATLTQNPDDIPFALLYLADEGTLRLQEAVRLERDSALAPARIAMAQEEATPWPIVRVLRAGNLEIVPVPSSPTFPLGLANQPVAKAILLPLQIPGHTQPLGALVAGINPTRQLDAEYRTFFELMASQVAAAIQNARAAEAQRAHAEMLAELDRAKTAFFSNVSHEFRTPLTLMLGPIDDAFADELQPLPAAQRERLLLVRRNAFRLQKLVNTLLDFSRVQAGRMQASFTPSDLAGLTVDLASSFRSVVESAGLLYQVECAPLSEPAYVDPSMWEKIVLNLISNAFKFTFEGAIRVGLAQTERHVVLTVADTGVGIGREQLPRIFERFQRIEGARSRTHEGSGIGLALVHDLVELHAGRIAVVSEPNRGTTFTVTLPLGHAHLREDQIIEAHPTTQQRAIAEAYAAEAVHWLPDHPHPEADLTPGKATETFLTSIGEARVLIADDNADMRAYLRRLLQTRWDIEMVDNGQQALSAALRHAPDLIVSDVMMPALDGFGLIAALRANASLSDIPVVLLSARAGEEARVEGLAAGADDYLVKPFSARELIARIDSQLVKRRISKIERQHAQRMADIFRQAPVGIAILRGPQHIFELINPSYAQLIGQRLVDGKPIREALPELAGQGIFELLDNVYQTAKPYVGRSLRVHLQRGAAGAMEECFFDFVYQPMIDGQGRTEGIAVVAFEVTELAQARQHAEVANRAKDEFLAMLGHELRNPLSPILIALELMRLRGATGIDKERTIIERQAQHLVRLVDDLMDVARIAQGKISLKREHIETARLIADAVEIASSLLEERKHLLTVDVPVSGLPINADPQRFAQVITNILNNAAKYTDPGGNVSVRAFREQDDVVIEVQDNGIGIAEEMLPYIFDKFVQERQTLARSSGGLGLGLAIVKSLVNLHGGTVQAHSAGLGRGSTFEVRVPIVSAQTQPADGYGHGTSTNNDRQLRSMTILVVDDIADVRESLATLLKVKGHTVLNAADATSALKAVDQTVPDVAILDLGLPGMDGYELASELRKKPDLHLVRLIALSGYGQEADQRRSADVGFAAHLIKPVDMRQLDALLEEAQRS